VEIAVHHGFEPSMFDSRASASHRHFVEHETEDVSQVFRLCGMGNTVGEAIEAERLNMFGGHFTWWSGNDAVP
jgi:hypothetical protein